MCGRLSHLTDMHGATTLSRSVWESKIISLQFENESEEISDAFNELISNGETKDNIIETLFIKYGDTLRHVCVNASKTAEEEDRASAGELTDPIAVWKHLCQLHSFREQLSSMSDQELGVIYRKSWSANSIACATSIEAAGRRRDAFEFFNEPSADANYEFWLKVGTWTIEEAVALSMGKDPEIVSSKSLSMNKPQKPSPFRDEFRKRIFLLERAQKGGYIGVDLRRDDIIEWFSLNDMTTPAEFSSSTHLFDPNYWKVRCLELEKKIESLKFEEANNNLDLKGNIKKTTIYKILLGISVCAYGHRVVGGSPAPLAIERDLALLREQSADELKISVGDDKIRDALDEAAECLSASWRGDLDLRIFEAWKQKNRGSGKHR